MDKKCIPVKYRLGATTQDADTNAALLRLRFSPISVATALGSCANRPSFSTLPRTQSLANGDEQHAITHLGERWETRKDLLDEGGFHRGRTAVPLRQPSWSTWGAGITEKVIWHIVKEYAKRAGIQQLAAHDCRRTCVRLCHAAGGELEQIQFLLGHVSVETTERYLGCKQRIRARVISMPSWEIFEQQSEEYRNCVMPLLRFQQHRLGRPPSPHIGSNRLEARRALRLGASAT